MKLDYVFLIANLGQLMGTNAIFSFWCDAWLEKATSQLTPSSIHPDDTADLIGEHIMHLNLWKTMNMLGNECLRDCSSKVLLSLNNASSFDLFVKKVIKLLGVENMSSTLLVHANGSIWTMVGNSSIIKT